MVTGDVAEERVAGAAGELAHVADAERRAGAGAAAAARRRALRLPRRARRRAASLQVRGPHTLDNVQSPIQKHQSPSHKRATMHLKLV